MVNKKLFVFVMSIVFVICTFTGAFGQEQGKQDKIAEVLNNGNNLSWLIRVPYESATLTVSAPNGKTFKREFSVGSPVSFSLMTGRNEFYQEGSFNYQLVLTPVLSADVKRLLAESRRDGKSSEVESDLRQKGFLPEAMIESGTFTVLNGTIIRGDKSETEAETDSKNNTDISRQADKTPGANVRQNNKDKASPEDQVVSDDLIVQGSACIGIDCQNNESFGSDILRLKENNTRMKFEDTSTTSGFPSNDWQLTANDSANGGANKFSIDDVTGAKTPFTIIAGAPTNSLFVDSIGRIGLRTSTPGLDIHVETTNTPAFRLEQNGAGGFTPQTWDIAGNEANFFIRDLTGGSRLPFRIRPGAPTSSIDIIANGDVGMGTSSPDGPLDISRGSDQLLLLDSEGKLTTKSSVEIKSGGLIFPDGTTQTTAASGSGGGGMTPGDTGSLGYLGANYSTHFIGGNGLLDPNFSTNARIDTNTNSIGAVSGGGTVFVKFNVATNLNLADTTAAFVVYKIRYRDNDGSGTRANVTVEVRANHIETGAVMSDVVFNSNTQAPTGRFFSTVTVCKPVDSVFYSFASYGTWIGAKLSAASATFGAAAGEADLVHIQVYKSETCP